MRFDNLPDPVIQKPHQWDQTVLYALATGPDPSTIDWRAECARALETVANLRKQLDEPSQVVQVAAELAELTGDSISYDIEGWVRTRRGQCVVDDQHVKFYSARYIHSEQATSAQEAANAIRAYHVRMTAPPAEADADAPAPSPTPCSAASE